MVVCARPAKPPFSPRDCAGDPGIIGIIPKRSSPNCLLIEDAPPPLIGSMQLNIMPPVLAPPQFGCVLPFMDSNIRASLPGDADLDRVGFTFDSGPVDGSTDPCDLKLEAIIRLPPLVFDMDYDSWFELIDAEITAAEWVIILGKLSASDWDNFPISGGGGGTTIIQGGEGGGGVLVKVISHTIDRTYLVEVYERGQDRDFTRTSDCIQLQLDDTEDTLPEGTWAIATEISRPEWSAPNTPTGNTEKVMYFQAPIWLPDGVAPTTSPTLAAATGNIELTGLPADGDNIVIDDGVNPAVTFEFDPGGGVSETETLREVTIGADAAETVSNLLIAINSAPLLSMLVNDGAGDSIDLENQTKGTIGNIALSGNDTALVQNLTGMAGGVD